MVYARLVCRVQGLQVSRNFLHSLYSQTTKIDFRALEGIENLGITAGASAPEVLINEVIDVFKEQNHVDVEIVETAVENVNFKVPRVLREPT